MSRLRPPTLGRKRARGCLVGFAVRRSTQFGKDHQRRNGLDLILIVLILILPSAAVSAIPGGDMAAASASAVFC
jgi:hypothetical protein